jgi:hypothetical protein
MSTPPTPRFPGVLRPTVDYDPISAELRTGPLFVDVDLATARSGAGALVLPIVGNSIYIDTRANTGTAQLIVYDESITPGPARITVTAGSILRIPFRSIAVENTAQAGQSLRVIYGVDLDFVPGTAAAVSIIGTPNVNIASHALTAAQGIPVYFGSNAPVEQLFTQSFQSTANLAIGGWETVLAPGSNVNGAVIQLAQFASFVSGGGDVRMISLLAKASAPTSYLDGQPILTPTAGGGSFFTYAQLNQRVRIAAGLGLYFYSLVAETQASRFVRYHLL